MYSYKLTSTEATQSESEPLVLMPGALIFSLHPYEDKLKASHVMIYTPEEGSINDISHAVIGDNPGVTVHSLAFLLKKLESEEYFVVNPKSAELGLLAAHQARAWAMTGTKIDYRKLNMMLRYSVDRDGKKEDGDELAIARASQEEAVFHTLKRVAQTERAPVRIKEDHALERGLTCPELAIDAFNATALDKELTQRGINIDKGRSYSNKHADLEGEHKCAVSETPGYAEYVISLRTRPKVLQSSKLRDEDLDEEETPHRHKETGNLQPCHSAPTIIFLPTELRKNIKPLYEILPFKLCAKRTTPEALMFDAMQSPHFKVVGRVQITATALVSGLNSKAQYEKEMLARSEFVNELRLKTLHPRLHAILKEMPELLRFQEFQKKNMVRLI